MVGTKFIMSVTIDVTQYNHTFVVIIMQYTIKPFSLFKIEDISIL